jgi:very-short-patch-repair endonuclease
MSRLIKETLLKNARHLRRQMTDVEKKMWYHLRSRRFQGYKFRRQFPMGSYIVDFICLEMKLIIECDGGQHNEPEEQEYDQRRTTFLNNGGYQVMRFWNHEVLEDWEVVEEAIYRELQRRRLPIAPPHP